MLFTSAPPHTQKPIVKLRKQEGQHCAFITAAHVFLMPVCSQKAVAQTANQNDLLLHICSDRCHFFSLQIFSAIYKDASVVGTLVILYTNLPMYSGPKKCKPS